MSEDEIAELLAELKASNDLRAARLRRGWYLIAAAAGCLLAFVALITLMILRNWFPWWLVAIAAAFEVGTFACLSPVTLPRPGHGDPGTDTKGPRG